MVRYILTGMSRINNVFAIALKRRLDGGYALSDLQLLIDSGADVNFVLKISRVPSYLYDERNEEWTILGWLIGTVHSYSDEDGLFRFLLQNGADPLKISPHWNCNAIQQAALVRKESTFEIFLNAGPTAGKMTPELTQLRGCYYMNDQHFQQAYDCFFDDGGSYVGNEIRLVGRFCQLLSQFVPHKDMDLMCKGVSGLIEENETILVPMVEYLITETNIPFCHMFDLISTLGVDLRVPKNVQITFTLLEFLLSLTPQVRSSSVVCADHKRFGYGREIKYLYSMASSVIFDMLMPHEELDNKIAEIVRGCSYKNQLLTAEDVYCSLNFEILEYLIEECGCDPNERSVDTSISSLSKDFFTHYYAKWQYFPSKDSEQIKELLYSHGAHICQTSYVPNPFATDIMMDDDSDWHFNIESKQWIDGQPRNLQCLAASCVVNAQLDVSGLPELLQKFVSKH